MVNKVAQSILLFFIVQTSLSQIIVAGKVLDKVSLEPIPFANIGIFKANIGTVSNPDGSFSLRVPENHRQDSITFSSLGFERKTISIQALPHSNEVIVYLAEKPTLLSEVSVHDRKVKPKTFSLGNTNMRGGTMETDTLYSGRSVALLIENKDPQPDHEFPLYLLSARLRILRSNLKVTRFRLRINEVDPPTGMPGNDMLEKSVIVESTLKSGWIESDLSSFAIVVSKPFFITFEQLTTKEDRTNIINGYRGFMELYPNRVRYDTVVFEGKKQVAQVFEKGGIDLPGTYIAIAPVWQNYTCYVRDVSFGEWKKVRGVVTATATLSTQAVAKQEK